MKVWKMLGCLVLLCGILCGCAILGRQTAIAAAGETGKDQGPENPGAVEGDTPTEAEVSGEPSVPAPGGSAAVDKMYSEGLRFRSNGDGTCALSGLGNCTASCLVIPPVSPAGDTVTEILPYALRGSIAGVVEIPETVTILTAASFSGCERLSYIRVAEGNTTFSAASGVLYNAERSLLCYCPAACGRVELTLPATLRRIAAGAFAECTALTRVSFAGNASAWHSVVIGDDNDPLYAAAFRFGT